MKKVVKDVGKWFVEKKWGIIDPDTKPKQLTKKGFNTVNKKFKAVKYQDERLEQILDLFPYLAKDPLKIRAKEDWVGLFVRSVAPRDFRIPRKPKPISSTTRVSKGVPNYFLEKVKRQNLERIPKIDSGKGRPAKEVLPREWFGLPTPIICTQFLFVWDRQYITPHKMDYEPVYVFYLPDDKSLICYDKFHYFIGEVKGKASDTENVTLTYYGPQRTFKVETNPSQRFNILDLKPIPLYDGYLEFWWSKEANARLKINSNMRNLDVFIGKDSNKDKVFGDPDPSSLSDRLFQKILYPFLFSASETTGLVECLELVTSDFLKPALEKIRTREILEGILGFYSLYYLFHLHGIINIVKPEGTKIPQFLAIMEKIELDKKFFFTTYLEKFIETELLDEFSYDRNDLDIKINETKLTNKYFQGLKSILEEDNEVLREKRIEWFNQSDYRELHELRKILSD